MLVDEGGLYEKRVVTAWNWRTISAFINQRQSKTDEACVDMVGRKTVIKHTNF
jgi:hypothetical protein